MRIALFFSGNYIRRYESNELKNLLKTKNQFIFFYHKKKRENQVSKKSFFFKHGFFSLILLEQKFAEILNHKYSYSKKRKKLLKKIEIKNIVKNYSRYKKFFFKTIKKRKKHIFDKSTIDCIKKKRCDLIIFLGFNKLIDAKMLDLVRHGILSFHTANTKKYRGRPSSYYEFINNEKFGGVTLQKLSNKIDAGEIINLKTTNISKCKSFEETQYKMLKIKNNMLVQGINSIKSKEIFHIPNKVNLNIETESKKFIVVMKCMIKTLKRRYFF